jgi:hypothetical protein
MRSLRTLGIAVAAALLGPVAAWAQQPEVRVEQIIANIVGRNPDLSSFQAHVDVRLHTGIPFLNPAMEGTTYFERPDRYEVIFTKAPAYARGVDKLYADTGDPAAWQKRFVVTLAGERAHQGHQDLVLHMVQRVRGMIEYQEALVDPHNWSVEEMSYHYYNGGVITVDQTYRHEGGYSVLSEQHAVIALPHLPRATGSAKYTDYRFNVAIDDGVFTEKETKQMGVGPSPSPSPKP